MTPTKTLSTAAAAVALSLLLLTTGCVSAPPANDDRDSSSEDNDNDSDTNDEEESDDQDSSKADSDIDGEVIETFEFENGLSVDVYVVGYGTVDEDSNYVNNDGDDLFPAGSKTVGVVYLISNPTDDALDVRGFNGTGNFEGSQYYSANDYRSESVTTELGYEEAPYDIYGFDADEWMLEPGDSVYFADTIYLEQDNKFIGNYSVQDGDGGYIRVDVELQF